MGAKETTSLDPKAFSSHPSARTSPSTAHDWSSTEFPQLSINLLASSAGSPVSSSLVALQPSLSHPRSKSIIQSGAPNASTPWSGSSSSPVATEEVGSGTILTLPPPPLRDSDASDFSSTPPGSPPALASSASFSSSSSPKASSASETRFPFPDPTLPPSPEEMRAAYCVVVVASAHRSSS